MTTQYGYSSKSPTTYVVTHAQAAMCRAAGLKTEAYGNETRVFPATAQDHQMFWATRLAFLRANPNAD